MNEQETIQCSRCKKKFFEDGFKVDRLGHRLKTCLECNARRRAAAQRHRARKEAGTVDKAHGEICKRDPNRINAESRKHGWRLVDPSTYKNKKTRVQWECLCCHRRAMSRWDTLTVVDDENRCCPKPGPSLLTDAELDAILAPIYAEMEPQKPQRREQYVLQVMSDDYNMYISESGSFRFVYANYISFDPRECFGRNLGWLQGVRIKAITSGESALVNPNGTIDRDDLQKIGVTDSEYQRARPSAHWHGMMRRKYRGPSV